MTEAEWLACDDPQIMLTFLREKASERKLRLFAAACCRRIWMLLPNEGARRLVELAERSAEGPISDEEWRVAEEAFNAGWDRSSAYNDYVYAYANEAVEYAAISTEEHGYRAASGAADQASWAACQSFSDAQASHRKAELTGQAGLLRCVFGNPFRPAIRAASVLAWNDGTVRRLAESIYNDRAFNHLPILADALEEAGCTDANILNHCRQPGEHVRGCWVVDLILGKS